MVIGYLKKFTLLPRSEIESLEARHAESPGAREAHRALAREVTTLVHGEAVCADVIRASEVMFGGGLEGLSEALFRDVADELPSKPIETARIQTGLSLADALVHAGLCPSKGQARKDIEGGGIYVNNQRIAEAARTLTPADILFGRHILLRKGKRTYALLTLT
jgi:tyrosyl-tRNA synthetase